MHGESRSDHHHLLLCGTPLLDTRSPIEFLAGAFPASTNLPLLTDTERARIGTCYKEQGQAAAIALGHELVSGDIRAARVQAWCEFLDANPSAALYCFRGGLRSQIAQQWIAEAGRQVPRIAGGYKALRRYLVDALPRLLAALQPVVIAGPAGAGKTRVLATLARALDLEALARHRGSAFGHLLEDQPGQISFENTLTIDLLRIHDSGPGVVFIEDEGHLIGRLSLPRELQLAMQAAPLLLLDEPLSLRVTQVIEDYIVDLGQRYHSHFAADGPARHAEDLLAGLDRIRRRLGGVRHQSLRAEMSAAFAAQACDGDVQHHRDWVEPLLRDYYDPMYQYQLQRRTGAVLARGNAATIGDAARGLLV